MGLRGDSSPTLRSDRWRLSCAAQLCSAFPVCRKEGLSKQRFLTPACWSSLEPGRVTWLWLKVRDEGTGEHGLKAQCIATPVAHSHSQKWIKKVKSTNSEGWVSPSVAVMLLTYFVILLHSVSFFLCLTLTTKEKKSSSNFKFSDSFHKLTAFSKPQSTLMS